MIEVWDGSALKSVALGSVDISSKRAVVYNRIASLLAVGRVEAIAGCMEILSKYTGARCAVYVDAHLIGDSVATALAELCTDDGIYRLSTSIGDDPRMIESQTDAATSIAIPQTFGCLVVEYRSARGRHELEKLVPISLYVSQALDLEKKKRDIRANREEIEKVASLARAKDLFLATMSHELRTPLSVMIGNLSMLAHSLKLSDRDSARLTAAITSGGQLSELIGDILDYVKLSAGRLALRIEPTEIRKMLSETVSIFESAFEEREIVFVWSVASSVPHTLMMDAQRTRQILVNFLSNALKFTDSGKVSVHVRARREKKAGASGLRGSVWNVTFAVSDTGCGISRERQPFIFDDFYQLAADQLDGAASGIGLGLAISRRLVNLMEGTISVSSDGETGSTFEFAAPLEESVDIIRAVEQRKDLLRGKHVLIVDDISDNRNYLADLFLRFGCAPFVCSSANDAHMYIDNREFRIDLGVFDVNMPGTNGVDLMRYTVRMRPELPVVALSSVGTDFEGNDIFDYIGTKAIAEHQMLRLVLEAVQKGKRSTVLPSPPQSPETRRILVVEDNQSNADMICDMLDEMGIKHVDVARNGQAALSAVRGADYGVVLMDLKMPVMNGLDATREIKKLPPPHPKIVALTASVMEGDKERCIRAGMQGHLSKPVTIEALRNIMFE